MSRIFHPLATVLMLGLLLSQSGCVALNIPSQRLYDPNDEGGLFGHWQGAKHRQPDWIESVPGVDAVEIERASSVAHAVNPTHVAQLPRHMTDRACTDCQPECTDCQTDSFDPLAGDGGPPPPEVPWPKFHPVPTRPVYGPVGVH